MKFMQSKEQNQLCKVINSLSWPNWNCLSILKFYVEMTLKMTLKWPWNDLEMDADDLSGEGQVPPMKKLEDLIHLAELCVDLLQQNEEHYADVNWNVTNNESIN